MVLCNPVVHSQTFSIHCNRSHQLTKITAWINYAPNISTVNGPTAVGSCVQVTITVAPSHYTASWNTVQCTGDNRECIEDTVQSAYCNRKFRITKRLRLFIAVVVVVGVVVVVVIATETVSPVVV